MSTIREQDRIEGSISDQAENNGKEVVNSTTTANEAYSEDFFPKKQTTLQVPSSRASRLSFDSTYSELSELSIHSTELQTRHAFSRNASQERVLSNSKSRIPSSLRKVYVANYGALLVLLAMFFGSLMNMSARLLETPGSHGGPMHPFQILFARQSITATLCTVYGAYWHSVPDFPFGPRNLRWLLISRGLTGFFGIIGIYYSLLYLPLSEATVLTFLAPILTCYLCSFLLPGETFSKQQQLAGFVSLIGVIFIARPASLFSSSLSSSNSSMTSTSNLNSTIVSSNNTTTNLSKDTHEISSSHHLAAIGMAMIGVLGATGAMTSIRAIGTQVHYLISINYFSVWCTVVSLFCLIVLPGIDFRLPGNWIEWGLLISLGLCGFVMQCLLTAGLAHGGPAKQPNSTNPDLETNPLESNASHQNVSDSHNIKSDLKQVKTSGTRATSMLYTQMLFALAGDKLVFGIIPDINSWIGSVLILAGAIWVATAKDKEGRNEKKDAFVGSSHDRDRPRPVKHSFGWFGKSNTEQNQRINEEEIGLMSLERGDTSRDQELRDDLEVDDLRHS